MVAKIIDDWRTAPVPETLRACLGFITKFADPDGEFDAEDIEAMRRTGLSDSAIRDMMYASFAFMVMSKSADAFGWPQHAPGAFDDKGRKNLSQMPYNFMALPG